MRKLITSSQFKKDLKKAKRQQRPIALLGEIIATLQHDEPLPASCRPHALVGNWHGHMECHISPDWLLGSVEIFLHRPFYLFLALFSLPFLTIAPLFLQKSRKNTHKRSAKWLI